MMAVKNVAIPGTLLIKASQALPQTATATLFTQSGVSGSILVTGLLGLVTTAIGGTATTVSLGTTGSNASIAAATTITSLTAGNWLIPVSNNTPAVMTVKAAAAYLTLAGAAMSAPFVLAPSQNITWTTSASTTGQIQWYAWYIPIDADSGLS